MFFEDNKKTIFKEVNLKFDSEERDSFWIVILKEDKEISIRLDIRILPQERAKYLPVGKARLEPNLEP